MFLALRELKHGKFRFIMIGVITILIAWLVFILSGLGNGLSTLSAAAYKNMNASYVTFEKGSKNSMSRSLLSESQVNTLKNINGVTDATPIGSSMATVYKGHSKSNNAKVDVAIIGIKPHSFIEPNIIEGSTLQSNNPLNVLANKTLKNNGFHIGDSLSIDGSQQKLKIVGFVKNESYNHLPAIFTTLDKWRSIQFAAPGSSKGITNPVNAIILQGKNIDTKMLNTKFPSTKTVTKSEAIQGIPGYKEESGSITMMLAFLLAISSLVLAVFFYVLTLQKSNQFGILKAIGASNMFLGKAIISQVFIISIISIAIAVLLTYETELILPKAMPFALSPNLVIIYAVILLVISILSSLVSVRNITKIDPLQAIGRNE